jgi:hypothetical protein
LTAGVNSKKSYHQPAESKFLLLFSIPFIIVFVGFLQGKQSIGSLSITFSILILPQLWFLGQSIKFVNGYLEKTEWFIYHQRIEIAKIANVKFGFGLSGRTNGLFRIDIYDNEKNKTEPFSINIKPFNRIDIQDISKRIIDSANQAQIDEQISKLANGEIKGAITQNIQY